MSSDILANIKRYVPISVKRLILKSFRFFFAKSHKDIKLHGNIKKSYPVSVQFPDLELNFESSTISRVDSSKVIFDSPGLSLIYADRLTDEKKLLFLSKVVENSKILIVFKSKYDLKKFVDYLGRDVDSDQVLFVPTIDSDIDNEIYSVSRGLADEFLGRMCTSFKAGDKFSGFSESISAMNVPVSDRIQGWIRCGLFIEKTIRKYKVQNFYFLSSFVSHMDLICFYIESRTGVASKIISTSKRVGSYTAQDLLSANWNLSWRPTISRYGVVDALKDKNSVVLYFGNLKDPQYRGTAKPILRSLSGFLEVPVVVLQSDRTDSELSFPNTDILVPDFELYGDDDIQDFIEKYDEAFSKLIAGSDSDDVGILNLFAMMNARRSLYRLLLDCYALKKDIDLCSANTTVKALVSNPGRLWISQYITNYLSDTPSFEIQSGTLSKTLRYQAPHSKFILSVDDYSREVYCDFLGVDSNRVYVVGAPRIDDKLSKVRGVSPLESRKQVSLPPNGELTCIATQPYGVELMTRMVGEVANLLQANQEHFLVVSMHPNETSEYEAAYRRVLGGFLESGQALISRGEIYHCMNASDNVVTFFSTSGIEAFCLKKRVFSFRPLDLESVPFDLCKLGVALPFSDSKELLHHLEGDVAARPSTIGLQNLQDGQSVYRICSFIEAHI